MAQTQVDQAVFASDNNARLRGYQLIARSSGINDRIAHELCRWSPTHGGLQSLEPSASAISYFPINEELVAIGRSVYGTPEYSGRGGLQVVTSYIITTRRHLEGFGNNPWSMSLMAQSMGYLRFNAPYNTQLPQLSMADRWSIAVSPSQTPNRDLVQATVEAIRDRRKVAVIGIDDPEKTLRGILSMLGFQERQELSFAVGLKPSSQRPFRLQLLADADVRLRAELSNNRIAIIKPAPATAPTDLYA